MKRIIVFGATGTVGIQIVKELLANNQSVTAFIRQNNYPLQHHLLHIIKGDVFKEAEVASAIEDYEIVISALGNMNFEDPTMIVAPFVKLAVKHIKASQRLIVISGSGLALHDAVTLRRDLPGQPEALKYPRQDHWEAYTSIVALDVDCTFVCPTKIESADADGNYVYKELYFPAEVQQRVKSGNVGRLVVMMIVKELFLRTRVAIADKAE